MLLLRVILATPDSSRLLKACECVPWYRLRPNECWNRCCHIWWNNCKQPTLNIYWLLKELGKVAGHQTCYHLVSSSNIWENFDTRQLWEKYWHLKILLVRGKTLTHFFLSDHIDHTPAQYYISMSWRPLGESHSIYQIYQIYMRFIKFTV